eukprot:TRINITY_DN7523_c0_g1_i1.p1 TRINITY_DN7523_c0_g1~~TRINITY_DN7523_c0_g1_i1.p1  ORF type:complete len:314 (-),score=59.21 TRINITY_DN7523_c0_g1_i1:67-1008(-)
MTTPAGAYGDLGKKAKAVLKTGSTKKPLEVQVNTIAKSNLKFKAYTDRKDGSLTIQLLPTFQHKRENYELGFSSIFPEPQYTLRGTWKPPVEGLQFKSSVSFGNSNSKKKKKKSAQGTFSVGSFYRSTVYTASASLKVPQLLYGNNSVEGPQPTLTINGTYKFGYLTFGAFVENKFIRDESNNQFQIQVSKLATAFDYSRDGTSVFVSFVKERSLQKEKFVASLNFYQKVRDDFQFGSEVSTESIFEGAKISFGGVWVVDPLSTLRAKINNEGQLGLSFRHKLNSSLTVTASADLNTVTAVGHKYGLHFNYLF